MDESALIKQSYKLICKDFGLEDVKEGWEEEKGFGWLEKFLTKEVNYLLDNDFNKLLTALYRIDIPESQVKELLHQSNQGEIAKNIAGAIIAREKQKIITRQQYSA